MGRSAIRGLSEEVAPDLIGPLVDLLNHDAEALVRAEAAVSLGDSLSG